MRRSSWLSPCSSPPRASAATTLDFARQHRRLHPSGRSGSTYGRVGAVLEQLRYIGVRRLRDTVVGVGELAPFRQAATAGLSFDLIVMGDPEAGPGRPCARLGPALHAVEGPNEVNVTAVRYRGQRGPAAAIAVQRTLYAGVKRDPACSAFRCSPSRWPRAVPWRRTATWPPLPMPSPSTPMRSSACRPIGCSGR